MLYYITILVLLIAFLLYQYFAFLRNYYIGQALHQFREIRHEVTLFLSYNVKNDLSLQKAIEYQQFLLVVDAIIKHFDRIKTEIISFKSVTTIYSNIILTSKKLAGQSEQSTDLNKYKDKVCIGLLTAFKAIPFCRARLFMFCLSILASVTFTLGFDRYRKKLDHIKQLSKIEKEMLNQNGMACH